MRFFSQNVLAAALLACACTGSVSAQGSAAPAPKAGDEVPTGSTGRGTLVLGADQKVFKPCGADREFWVNDATGGDLAQVYEKLAGGTGKPLFVDVRGVLEQPPKTGAGSTYPRVLRIVELRRADPAGAGCRENLRYFELRAWGDDPFWRVDVSRSGIIWSSYGAPSSVAFPYGPPRRDGAANPLCRGPGGRRPPRARAPDEARPVHRSAHRRGDLAERRGPPQRPRVARLRLRGRAHPVAPRPVRRTGPVS